MRTIEEIKADLEMLESFGINSVEMHDRLIGYLEELLNYRQAERDGRCVVLPCKVRVGDSIYLINRECTKIEEVKVNEIVAMIDRIDYSIYKRGGGKGNYGIWGFISSNSPDWGKLAFLTREEAEKALKGGASE
jgi:hypothetical protein